MQKISTLILSEEFSTTEVLKLFVSEFDNLELIEHSSNYSEILNTLSNTAVPEAPALTDQASRRCAGSY
jgi:hypothetical protein